MMFTVMAADRERKEARPPARSEAVRDAEIVGRALDVMELLALNDQGFPVREVAGHFGMRLDVAQEILSTLARRGFVDLDPRSNHYAAGTKLLELADAGAARVRKGV
jgi:DNA-binding IclR family transcriptional regulator